MAGVTRRVDLALLPAEAALIDADCTIVVDLLRATTTIVTLFEAGLRALTAMADLDAARDLARREGALLAGEVGGLPPAGFDFGNSPLDAREADVAGRDLVLFTTNGTRALCAAASRGGRVLAGALANVEAVARAASASEHVLVMCAGNAGGLRFSLEDFVAAGRIIQRLQRLAPGVEPGDAAGLAVSTPGYEDWIAASMPQQTGHSAHMIMGSEHGRALLALGLAGDIHFAAQENTASAVPQVVDFGEGWARLAV